MYVALCPFVQSPWVSFVPGGFSEGLQNGRVEFNSTISICGSNPGQK